MCKKFNKKITRMKLIIKIWWVEVGDFLSWNFGHKDAYYHTNGLL